MIDAIKQIVITAMIVTVAFIIVLTPFIATFLVFFVG